VQIRKEFKISPYYDSLVKLDIFYLFDPQSGTRKMRRNFKEL